MDCADENACTYDYCNEEIGECVHPPREDCDVDEDSCHVGFCDKETGRCATQQIDCDDGTTFFLQNK
jgi:hypothetical protein